MTRWRDRHLRLAVTPALFYLSPLRRQGVLFELRRWRHKAIATLTWIPAYAGMTRWRDRRLRLAVTPALFYLSPLRRQGVLFELRRWRHKAIATLTWIPAYAGMTQWRDRRLRLAVTPALFICHPCEGRGPCLCGVDNPQSLRRTQRHNLLFMASIKALASEGMRCANMNLGLPGNDSAARIRRPSVHRLPSSVSVHRRHCLTMSIHKQLH
jgi:hypothetical protein